MIKLFPSILNFSRAFIILVLMFITLSSIAPFNKVMNKEPIPTSARILLSCTQSDLIICNASSVLGFVDQLVAELDNQLNNCGTALANCNGTGPCCYSTSDFTLQSAVNGKNPWFYCTRQSCSSFTCSSLVGGGSQHNDLSVADQNAVLSFMRTLAGNFSSTACSGSYGPIHKYEVYRTGPSGSCSVDGPCFDVSIKMKVTYLCNCGS